MKLLYQLILTCTVIHGFCYTAALEIKTNAEKKDSAAKNMQQWELKFFDGMFFISDKAISDKAIERENRTACIATAFDKLPKEKLLQMPQCIETLIAKKHLEQQKTAAFPFIQKNKLSLIPAVVPSKGKTHITHRLLSTITRHKEYCADYNTIAINPIRACFESTCFFRDPRAGYTTGFSTGITIHPKHIGGYTKHFNVMFCSMGYTDETMKWYVPKQFIKQLMQLSVNQLHFVARLFHLYQRGTEHSNRIILEQTGTMAFSINGKDALIHENDKGAQLHPVIMLSQEDTKVFRSLPEDIQKNLLTSYMLQFTNK